MNFLHSDDIWKFIRAKDKRDNNENQCQCTCDECGAECEPFWKKEQTNEK